MRTVIFAAVGIVLATGGIGVADWQLYATLILMAVAVAIK